MKIYSYNNGSKSAKALANALGCKLIKHGGNPLQVRGFIINWGCSQFIRHVVYNGVLNHPHAVKTAVNKLSALKVMKEWVSVPEFTESLLEAAEWSKNGFDVVVRHKLNGHSGEGIEIFTSEKFADPKGFDYPIAPLYTKYIPKEHEWRVHVFQGEVFFVQRKARKLDVEDDNVNWKVRNLAGGFIYANQNVVAPENVLSEAKNAIMALGLDFGAVDVITKKNGKTYVLEVNTACGLMNSTLDAYVEQFKKLEN